jgi:CelD/BcsL family acetyltransferase involved in cellulose biosynthesis
LSKDGQAGQGLTCYRWKSQQMLETLGFDAFADERNRRFFPELRAAGLLNASTLRAEGRLLAAWLGAVHDGRWYGWIFTYDRDPALRKLSLGRLLLYRMLEESHRLGHREFDFSIGEEPYKWFFATHARMIAPLGTPPLRLRARRVAVATLKAFPSLERRVRALRDWKRSPAGAAARTAAEPTPSPTKE